jgi:hypothetical protein
MVFIRTHTARSLMLSATLSSDAAVLCTTRQVTAAWWPTTPLPALAFAEPVCHHVGQTRGPSVLA